MKKNVFGRKFKRDTNERKALFKNLLTSLVLKERIRTTEAKAKAIKGAADKLITKAKKDNAYKNLHAEVNQDAVVKLIDDIAKRFEKRAGGYTRIIKIGKRRVADNAEMVYIEWTEPSTKLKVQSEKLPKKAKKVKKEAKKVPAKVTKVPKAEMKKQPKLKEVARKQITRQKKGQ